MKVVGIVHKDEGSCFGIYFPQVPGCFSAGDTMEQLIENSREALDLSMEDGPLVSGADWMVTLSDLAPEDIEELVIVLIFDI